MQLEARRSQQLHHTGQALHIQNKQKTTFALFYSLLMPEKDGLSIWDIFMSQDYDKRPPALG